MYVEALAGQVLIGEPWSLEICGKRNQHHIFLDNGHFASEKVLVFKFQFHLGRLVLCVCVCACVCCGGRSGKTLVLGTAGGQSSLLCSCFGFMT